MRLVNISRSRNYSSEIYRKWDWLIYLALEITQARYIKNWIGWYISLEKLLEQDISKIWSVNIYLAQEITWARYIKNGIGWFILLEKFLKQDISKMGLVDISCSRNFSSKIHRKWDWWIYLAQEISLARCTNQSNFRYISRE